MFDIGFPELLIVSVVALLVLGPERLPEALRTLGLWFGRMRRSFSAVKVEIEREIGMDEVRRQLHNEAILEEMRELESSVNTIGQNITTEVETSVESDAVPKPTNTHDATVEELDAAMRDLEANVKVVNNNDSTEPHHEEGEAPLEEPRNFTTDDFQYSNEPHPDDEFLNNPDVKPDRQSDG